MDKGLLVDFGGVLTTSVVDSFAAFARAQGTTPEAMSAAMRGLSAAEENLFHLVERGSIDLAEFERRLAGALSRELGVPVHADGLKARLFASSVADELMLGALRRARASGVRTCLVSNSWGIHDGSGPGGYPREMFDEVFDSVVISGEVGLRKPEPEIYVLAAGRIGCEAAACAFVDDFQINVDGAGAVGMHGILHRDAATTIAKLEAFLGVPLA